MKGLTCIALFAFLGNLALSSELLAAAKNLVPALLFDGQTGDPQFPGRRLTTSMLKKELEETGLFRATVLDTARSGDEVGSPPPDFEGYKVIVLSHAAPNCWPPDLRTRLERFVDAGGGLVVVAAAANACPDWPSFDNMTGMSISNYRPGSAGSHGPRVPFEVETQASGHPAMKGLPHLWVHATDDSYATLRGPGKNTTVLATSHSDSNNQGPRYNEPIIVAVNYGKGRVFHTTLGTTVAALGCVGFITTFQRGTEWAATGGVTQKVPVSFPTADTTSIRIDIARMDPEFSNQPVDMESFDGLGEAALLAMKKRAGELKVGGVAVVAYFEGDSIQSWVSKMSVVGRLKDNPSQKDPGNNLLAIAYSKASEMADTLKASGSKVRPLMTGEFGWRGGVIARGKKGYLIAAFSGGEDADDIKVSEAGIAELSTGL